MRFTHGLGKEALIIIIIFMNVCNAPPPKKTEWQYLCMCVSYSLIVHSLVLGKKFSQLQVPAFVSGKVVP